MRQTQINGETYVNMNDLCDWLIEESAKAIAVSGQFDDTTVKDAAAGGSLALNVTAETLRKWGNDPARTL